MRTAPKWAKNISQAPCFGSVPLPGWVSISLKEDLVKRIEAFIRENDEGYSNRSEVVAAAVRQFVDAYYARKALERAVRGRPVARRPGAAAPGRARRR